MGQSGKAIGLKYLQALLEYLTNTLTLPVNPDGTLNMSKIAEEAGVPRQSLYKNPRIKAVLEDTRHSRGIPNRPISSAASQKPPVDSNKLTATGSKAAERRMERRINQLEQQNSVLVAENAELRKKLVTLRLQLGREDMIIETGRRIPVPSDHA